MNYYVLFNVINKSEQFLDNGILRIYPEEKTPMNKGIYDYILRPECPDPIYYISRNKREITNLKFDLHHQRVFLASLELWNILSQFKAPYVKRNVEFVYKGKPYDIGKKRYVAFRVPRANYFDESKSEFYPQAPIPILEARYPKKIVLAEESQQYDWFESYNVAYFGELIINERVKEAIESTMDYSDESGYVILPLNSLETLDFYCDISRIEPLEEQYRK